MKLVLQTAALVISLAAGAAIGPAEAGILPAKPTVASTGHAAVAPGAEPTRIHYRGPRWVAYYGRSWGPSYWLYRPHGRGIYGLREYHGHHGHYRHGHRHHYR